MAIEYEVSCECGWSYRGVEDDIVAAIQQHAKEVHGLEVTREQAMAQVRPVQG